jgi:hypothetical protein
LKISLQTWEIIHYQQKVQDSFEIISRWLKTTFGLLRFVQAQTSEIFKYDVIIIIVGIARVLISCSIGALALLKYCLFSLNSTCTKDKCLNKSKLNIKNVLSKLRIKNEIFYINKITFIFSYANSYRHRYIIINIPGAGCISLNGTSVTSSPPKVPQFNLARTE